jgi:hypothetical protein
MKTKRSPTERLRNKLTPFLNLVAMLENRHFDQSNLIKDLLVKELKQCKLNSKMIHKYLKEMEIIEIKLKENG